jgi:hypothetical protein
MLWKRAAHAAPNPARFGAPEIASPGLPPAAQLAVFAFPESATAAACLALCRTARQTSTKPAVHQPQQSAENGSGSFVFLNAKPRE